MNKALIFSLFFGLSAHAFDSRSFIECDNARIEHFDNLSNGASRLRDVFAIVTLPEDPTQAIVMTEGQYRFEYATDFKNFAVVDMARQKRYPNCKRVSDQIFPNLIQRTTL